MTPRLASRIEVSALIRRVEGLGGNATVLARGDAEAGAILLVLAERGVSKGFLERVLDVSGTYRWQRVGPQDIVSLEEVDVYIRGRRRSDSDLWVLELDIAGVERFADEMIVSG